MSSTVGIVLALSLEARRIFGFGRWRRLDEHPVKERLLKNGDRMVAVLAGPGLDNAYAATRWLVDRKVSALVSIGLAGGLFPGSSAGDLVVAESVVHINDNALRGPWFAHVPYFSFVSSVLERKNLYARNGCILSGSRPISTVAEKHALHRTTGALCVDMESAAIAETAVNAGLPFFAARAICDPADRKIAPQISACLNNSGRVRISSLVFDAIRKPALVVDLARLTGYYAAAGSALNRIWRAGVLESLPYLSK